MVVCGMFDTAGVITNIFIDENMIELSYLPTRSIQAQSGDTYVTPQKIFELRLEPLFVVSEIFARNLKFLEC